MPISEQSGGVCDEGTAAQAKPRNHIESGSAATKRTDALIANMTTTLLGELDACLRFHTRY